MGKYQTIVADPPWRQGATGLNHGGFLAREKFAVAEMPYKSMSLEEIINLPVWHVAAKDAHLYLWTTQKFLRDSFDVAWAWGFAVSATMVWCKQPTGLKLGGAFPASLEFVHFCRKGSLAATGQADKRWWTWPRAKTPPVAKGQKRPYQGSKPEAFLDLVEQVSPGPYLEMFARRARFGWDYWGDQSLETADLDA